MFALFVQLSTRDLEVPGSSPGDANFRYLISLEKELTHIAQVHSAFTLRWSINRVPVLAGIKAGIIASVGCCEVLARIAIRLFDLTCSVI